MTPIPTTVWRLAKEGTFPRDICDKVIRSAQVLLKRVGLNLQIDRHIDMPEPPVFPGSPFHYPGLIRAAIRSNAQLYPREPGRLYHVLTPPIYSGRYAFLGGTSGAVGCMPDNWLTISTAGVISTLIDPSPSDYIASCAHIMAHEIAHCFGAQHVSQPGKHGTIMHPYINMWNRHHKIKWAKISRQQIKRFMDGL